MHRFIRKLRTLSDILLKGYKVNQNILGMIISIIILGLIIGVSVTFLGVEKATNVPFVSQKLIQKLQQFDEDYILEQKREQRIENLSKKHYHEETLHELLTYIKISQTAPFVLQEPEFENRAIFASTIPGQQFPYVLIQKEKISSPENPSTHGKSADYIKSLFEPESKALERLKTEKFSINGSQGITQERILGQDITEKIYYFNNHTESIIATAFFSNNDPISETIFDTIVEQLEVLLLEKRI